MHPIVYIKTSSRALIHSILTLFAISVINFVLPLSAFATDPFVGNIKTIQSDSPFHQASILHSGAPGNIGVAEGDAVFAGDTITTSIGVRISVLLSDGSLVSIGPGASIHIKDYVLNHSLGRRNYTLKALQGSIRFMIAKLVKDKATDAEIPWKDSNVNIETPTATAGVRGTDFVVIIGDADVEIAVFEGAVQVKSTDASVAGDVILGANQVSRVLKGLRPDPPSVLTPEGKDKLMRYTTPAKDLKAMSGKAGPGGKKDNKDEKLNIAQDLATGIPLREIVGDAIQEGATIQTVVTEAITQRVDPSLIVYTAITEGYSAQSVVQAALEAGAPLDAVVVAAIGAGADKKTIYVGAAAAGAPPAAVANAIATASAPAAPVFGYTSPVEAPPSVYTPPAPVSIGGGGGGTPSTQPASPFKP